MLPIGLLPTAYCLLASWPTDLPCFQYLLDLCRSIVETGANFESEGISSLHWSPPVSPTSLTDFTFWWRKSPFAASSNLDHRWTIEYRGVVTVRRDDRKSEQRERGGRGARQTENNSDCYKRNCAVRGPCSSNTFNIGKWSHGGTMKINWVIFAGARNLSCVNLFWISTKKTDSPNMIIKDVKVAECMSLYETDLILSFFLLSPSLTVAQAKSGRSPIM